MHVTLILGGARSGKSRRAELLAEKGEGNVTYIATSRAEVDDTEWRKRVRAHQVQRPRHWVTREIPLDLGDAIGSECSAPSDIVIVDCLTLWLSNWMLARRPLEPGIASIERGLSSARGAALIVSNEVGSGVVPVTEMGRAFRDEQGRLNQRIASVANCVELVVAGIPLAIKGTHDVEAI